jgi:Zn/Cd-binding protein ZinT
MYQIFSSKTLKNLELRRFILTLLKKKISDKSEDEIFDLFIDAIKTEIEQIKINKANGTYKTNDQKSTRRLDFAAKEKAKNLANKK